MVKRELTATEIAAADRAANYYPDWVERLGLTFILVAWREAGYGQEEVRAALLEWLSHCASWEFNISQWEGLRVGGTFPGRRFDIAKPLSAIWSQQVKAYVLGRAWGFTDEYLGKLLQAAKAVAAERAYQEGRKYFVLRKKRARVTGKGSSGRQVTKLKRSYADQVGNGSRCPDPVKVKATAKPKRTVEQLNALVKKIREGGEG